VNVVEEMAIASGSPMPTIYLIDCDSINAFAAGQSPETAVIGVTRGSLRKLDRDELQGVIAHEFSHIRHQDTRINARAVIAIAGLMAIGTVGKILVFFIGPGLMVVGGAVAGASSSSSRRSRGRNSDGGGALGALLLGLLAGLVIIAIGLVFWAIGSSGVLYGRIIQAAISRGREFLADATAVDYTRNPDGIADALRKIRDSRNAGIPSWAASGLNHFLFTSGVGTILDSHPSIRERIRRLVAMGASPHPGD
jgi:Zn-dependent protease with chaperone function